MEEKKAGSGRAVYALQDGGVAIVEDLHMAAVQADRMREPMKYYTQTITRSFIKRGWTFEKVAIYGKDGNLRRVYLRSRCPDEVKRHGKRPIEAPCIGEVD